jgi:hypothetical protein
VIFQDFEQLFAWRTVLDNVVYALRRVKSLSHKEAIEKARYYLNTPPMFAGLVVISLPGILVDTLFILVERHTVGALGNEADLLIGAFMLKKYWFATLLIAPLLYLSACGNAAPGGSSAAPQSVTIAYQPSLGAGSLVVIRQEGTLEKQFPQTHIQWKVLNNGSAVREAVVANQVQIAYLGVPPFLVGWDRGVNWRILTAETQVDISHPPTPHRPCSAGRSPPILPRRLFSIRRSLQAGISFSIASMSLAR